jgi:hypothetical protein
LGEREIIAFHAVHALVAELRAIHIQAIETALTLPHDVTVTAVFVLYVAKDQVTIFALKGEIAIIGVLALLVHNTHAWNLGVQPFELIENGVIPIRFKAIIECVPLVAPPLVHFEYGTGEILVVHGNDLLACEVAFAVIQIFEVAKHDTPLHAAWGAHFRVGQIEFLVKLTIGVIDVECDSALRAVGH